MNFVVVRLREKALLNVPLFHRQSTQVRSSYRSLLPRGLSISMGCSGSPALEEAERVRCLVVCRRL